METNNVSYELLAMSNSDSPSELPKVLNTKKKRRIRRRSQSSSKSHSPSNSPRNKVECTRNRIISVGLLVGVLLCWLFTLTWIAVALHIQTSHLQATVQGVAAGSQGVPDALQKCHSLSRELQNNQTKLFNQLASLSQHLSNFTAQIGIVQGGLANVEEKLMASPELVNVPHDLQALTGSVASFGSQIQDLQTTSNHLKDEHNTILQKMKALDSNITGVNYAVQNFSTNLFNGKFLTTQKGGIAEIERKIETLFNLLKVNLTVINETLSKGLQWARVDINKNQKSIQDMQDVSANVSSHISTIQNEMTDQQTKFKTTEKQFSDTWQEVDKFKALVVEANRQLAYLNEKCKKLENIANNLNETNLSKTTPPHDYAENTTTGVRTNDSIIANGSEVSQSSMRQGDITTNKQ